MKFTCRTLSVLLPDLLLLLERIYQHRQLAICYLQNFEQTGSAIKIMCLHSRL